MVSDGQSLDNVIISNWPYFGVYSSNGYWGKFEKYSEYSKLFLQLQNSCKLFDGLDDFKVALYVCPITETMTFTQIIAVLTSWEYLEPPP